MAALRNPKHERYAFERALGQPRREAERRAGYIGKHTGISSKLEAKPKVVARIEDWRKAGFTEEMQAAIRVDLHGRLNQIANGTRDDFDVKDLDRGGLPDWTQVLGALNQLRDMHGFKGVNRVELSALRALSDDELDAGIIVLARRIVAAAQSPQADE